MCPTYQIYCLLQLAGDPDREEVTRSLSLVKQYRELRLTALKTAPEAFASSYEVEEKRDLEHTWQRLSNPKGVNFVAVQTGHEDAAGHMLPIESLPRIQESTWIGGIALIGPQEDGGSAVSAKEDAFAKMTAVGETPAGNESSSEGPKTFHYHLNGVFVHPSARGAGLGMALIKAALDQARADASTCNSNLWVSILVNEENNSARKLYEKAGFRMVGQETYVLQPRSLAGESRAVEKVALSMELREPPREVSHK